MPSNHKKDKPWDLDTIDKWKQDPFTPEDNVGGSFAEESSFAVLFPKYREQYLKGIWPLITKALAQKNIACTLDLINGQMSVKTTLKTFDPAAILKARDLIKLLSRSVPAPQAIKILEDDIAADVIKIRGLCRSRDKFVKRRQRILGPNGSTLKAIMLLTDTYIMVQGSTVSVMGPFKGLKTVRRIITDTLSNIHPIYAIKEELIKRELAKDPELANENWDRFLPNYKKRTLNRRRKPHKITDKSQKNYTPFPPPREKSKIDLQMESGEYFLGQQAKERKAREEREERQRERAREKKERKEREFVPPKEDGVHKGEGEVKKKKKKRKRGENVEGEGGEAVEDGASKKKKRRKSEVDEEDGGVELDEAHLLPRTKQVKKEKVEGEMNGDATKVKKKRKRKTEDADAEINGVASLRQEEE